MQDKQSINSLQSSIKTYADLEAAYSAHLRSENKSEQDVKNFRSNLNVWRKSFNAELDTKVNLHFNENFLVNLEKFKTKQFENNAKESTVASKVSNLKKVNEFLTAKFTLENLSSKFGERLYQLIRNAGFNNINSFWAFHLKEKCRVHKIRNWCKGINYPSESSIGLVEELETIFQVPAGFLSSLLRSTFNKKKATHKERTDIARLRLINSYSYRIWEKNLEEEFQELLKFKTDRVLPEGIERHSKGNWTSAEGRGFGAANMWLTSLHRFFGYLHLSENNNDRMFRGMGYSKDRLTLGLLADKSLVENYVTGFMRWRSFDKYHNGHIHFLSICTSLLRPVTGYLYQHAEFALKIGIKDGVKEWQEKCADTRNRLLKIQQNILDAKNSGSEDFQMARDPKIRIADILALRNPISVVMDMLGIMLTDIEAQSHGKKKAILFRDIILIALMVANPLRISMFSIMKFDRNLIRKEDGSWWIHFKREDFKNRKSIRSDYAVLVAPELAPLIDRYKEEFRPLLFGAAESDYVFLRRDDSSKVQPREKKKSLKYKSKPAARDIYSLSPAVLSKRIATRVMEYLDLPQGFYAHAFRHIVATNVIKNNPETGFFLASKVLHDKFETVEHNYAHLKTHEFFEPYNRFISGFFSKIINADGNSISSENGGGEK